MSDWFATLALVFGGCCSNAITLEQITSRYPDSGTLITFFQFLLISLHGLPRHATFSGNRFPYVRLRSRKIPLTPYLLQVALFYAASILNNAAFGYQIAMPVHIIFRSGGLIVSMLLGWSIAKKRYTLMQIVSVIVVTLGVILTTLSASQPKSKPSSSVPDNSATQVHFTTSYAIGIIILSVALIFAGLLGLVQDWTFSQYRSSSEAGQNVQHGNEHATNVIKGDVKKGSMNDGTPAWQESMFYLHFLAMPLFLFVWNDLVAQFHAVHAGPRMNIPFSISALYQSNSWLSYPLNSHSSPTDAPQSLSIPTAYLPLLFNTLTQLLCVSGVHKLTGKVSSLTVTLTLVVRKAVSLVISVVMYGGDGIRNVGLWVGAALVLAGTIGYSMGGKKQSVERLQTVSIRKKNREKGD